MTTFRCSSFLHSRFHRHSTFVLRHFSVTLAAPAGCSSALAADALMRVQSFEEIFEERVVNAAALRVILHSASEGIFLQMYLLDNSVVRRPGLNFQIVAEPFDRLVMRAVHF